MLPDRVELRRRERTRFSEDVIGPLLATAAFSEAGLMFVFSRIAARFSARSLILASAVAAVFRWSCMALQPDLHALFAEFPS